MQEANQIDRWRNFGGEISKKNAHISEFNMN